MKFGSSVTMDGTRPVAVFVHVHYPEIWQDIASALAERMNYPFTLLITTTGSKENIAIPSSSTLQSTQVFEVNNQGRDILPFLQVLSTTADFEVGLKLHTKKSPQRDDGALWRDELLRGLIPVKGGGATVARRLQADPRIGFVPPAGFSLSVRPWIGINQGPMDRVMATVGLDDRHLDDAFFAAGSMFWFRRDAFMDLASEPTLSLFEEEAGQLDATTAHAMERIFPVAARGRGLLSLPMTALIASHPSMPAEKLVLLARRHSDLPSTLFPAPNVLSLPATKEGMRKARAIHRAHRNSSGRRGRFRRAVDLVLSRLRRLTNRG